MNGANKSQQRSLVEHRRLLFLLLCSSSTSPSPNLAPTLFSVFTSRLSRARPHSPQPPGAQMGQQVSRKSKKSGKDKDKDEDPSATDGSTRICCRLCCVRRCLRPNSIFKCKATPIQHCMNQIRPLVCRIQLER
jgi:hypothetical protein